MFGRVAVLPVDINACGSYDPEVVLEQFANASEPGEGSQSEERQEMEKKIKENILSAQTKQKSTMTRSMLVERYLTLEHLY